MLMTLERAKQLLAVQADFGGFYNGNSSKLILSEVQREHGQAAVDQLILELKLDRIFGFKPGTRFEGGLAIDAKKIEAKCRKNKKRSYK
jgi:hypothetical protein